MDSSTDGKVSANSMESTSKIVFKSSILSSTADKLWEQRKNEFKLIDREHNGPSLAPAALNINYETKKDRKENGHQVSASVIDKANSLNCNAGQNDVGSFIKPVSSTSHFVFGAKVSDRVVDCNKALNSNDREENGEKKEISEDCTIKQPTAEDMLHELAEKAENNDEEVETEKASTTEKLRKAAESVEKSSKNENCPVVALNPEFTVITGEENETNIHHGSCKIHVFDVESNSWHERGSSTVRINEKTQMNTDGNDVETRIVVRTLGNQRVILNTKLWPEMVLERSGPRRFKLSAVNSQVDIPLLFLITASESSIDTMFALLEKRLSVVKKADRKRKLDCQIIDEAGEFESKATRK